MKPLNHKSPAPNLPTHHSRQATRFRLWCGAMRWCLRAIGIIRFLTIRKMSRSIFWQQKQLACLSQGQNKNWRKLGGIFCLQNISLFIPFLLSVQFYMSYVDTVLEYRHLELNIYMKTPSGTFQPSYVAGCRLIPDIAITPVQDSFWAGKIVFEYHWQIKIRTLFVPSTFLVL